MVGVAKESAINGHDNGANARSRSPHGRGNSNSSNEKVSDKDGHSAADIFEDTGNFTGYTYDDLICLPGHINFGVSDVFLGAASPGQFLLKHLLFQAPWTQLPSQKWPSPWLWREESVSSIAI